MNITIKRFLNHLQASVEKITTKDKTEMRTKIDQEWDQTHNILEYFNVMERTQLKLERWGITNEMDNMVPAAVKQMQDSRLFDHKFLWDWETQEDDLRTWGEAMKLYYGCELTAIKTYSRANIKSFDTISSVTESDKIS